MKLLVALCACVLVVQPATCSEGEALLEDRKIPNTCTFAVMKTTEASKGEGIEFDDGRPGAFSKIDAGQESIEAARKLGNFVEKQHESIWCRPAKFGDQYTQDRPNSRPGKNTMAQPKYLTIANSENACDDKVCDGGVCDDRVVLVFRGGCGFYDKAKNVWGSSKGKAAAIVVADTQPASNGMPITMFRGNEGDKKHDIERFLATPVVAILKETGEELKEWLSKGKGVMIAMDFHKWLDRENEFRLKGEIKDGAGNTSATWHNLAVSMLNQGRENQAIAAMEYSEILNPTAEIYEAQSQIYKEAMYVFKGARQLCRAALVSAEPKQSLEYRKKAKELFQETFEGRTLAHSSGDVHVCDLRNLYNVDTAAGIFKGQSFAKEMYPKDPSQWSAEDQAAGGFDADGKPLDP